MPDLSAVEIVVVAMLALIVFGPEKLPEIARTLGRTISDLRRMANEARADLRSGLDGDVSDEPEEGSDGDVDAPAAERPQ